MYYLNKMYLIVYHIGFQMIQHSCNLNKNWWYNKLNKIITHWDSFLTYSLFQQNTIYNKINHYYVNCGNNKHDHVTLFI